jgi:hypothetical protein
MLPNAQPIWTIGPSRPTDPPEPMQIALASALMPATRGRIFPFRCRRAYMTSGTPCPSASGAHFLTIDETMRRPIAGSTIT